MPKTVAQNVGQINVLFLDETRPEIFRQEGNNDSNLGETRSMQFEQKMFLIYFAVMEQLLQLVGVLSYAIASSTGELHRSEETQDHRQVKLSKTPSFSNCYCCSSLIAKHRSQQAFFSQFELFEFEVFFIKINVKTV